MTLSNEKRMERRQKAQENQLGYRTLPVIYGSKIYAVLEFAKFFNRPVSNREIFEFTKRFNELSDVTKAFAELRSKNLVERVGEKHKITPLGINIIYICARKHADKTFRRNF